MPDTSKKAPTSSSAVDFANHSSAAAKIADTPVAPQSDVVAVSVDRQEGCLIPFFEVLDEETDCDKRKPWRRSCIWYASIDPQIAKEYSLLEKAIKNFDEGRDGLLSENVQSLHELNPAKYTISSVRIDRELLTNRFKELDAMVRSHNTPYTRIVRHDATGTKTNSFSSVQNIMIETFQFPIDDTLRIQMNSAGTLFLDLRINKEGGYGGCAVLNLFDKDKTTKFGENYVSPGIDKEAVKAVINGLTGGFIVNGVNISPEILASLDGHKAQKEKSQEEKTSQEEKPSAEKSKSPSGVGVELARVIS